MSIFVANMWSDWRSHVVLEMFCFYVNSRQDIWRDGGGDSGMVWRIYSFYIITISKNRNQYKMTEKMALFERSIVVNILILHHLFAFICLLGRCHRSSTFRSWFCFWRIFAPQIFKKYRKKNVCYFCSCIFIRSNHFKRTTSNIICISK